MANRLHASTNAQVLRLMQSNLTVEELRAASPLEENAQKLYDKAVVQVGLSRLVFAGDIIQAGLTFPINDPLSVMEVQWERESKTGGAQRTMNPSARGENQLPDRSIRTIPIYLTTDDFNLGIRTLKASERAGTPLDTTLASAATRRVNEAIEDASINGAGITLGTGTTPGVLNAPNAKIYTLSVDWTAPNVVGTTGPAMVNDLIGMVGVMQANKKYGPYRVYTATPAFNGLAGDFKTNTADTIYQRLTAIPGLEAIKAVDQFPVYTPGGPQLFMIQMTDDVVDMITGMAPTMIPWTSNDGFTLFYMIMAIMVPRFKDDYDGNSGIVIGVK